MSENRWNGRFEEMMKKQRKTQEKLKMLQTQRLLEEMKEVTGIPKINEVSRKVANELDKLKAESQVLLDPFSKQKQSPSTVRESNRSQLSKSLTKEINQSASKDFKKSATKDFEMSHTRENIIHNKIIDQKEIVIPFQNSNNLQAKEFKDLQETFVRAQNLHSQQQNAQVLSPRCHINLATGQSSQQYLNLRAPVDGKVGNLGGMGQAETLRRDFLNSSSEEEQEEPDMYMKNIQWAKKREEKLNEQRWDKQISEIAPCTFKPAITNQSCLRSSFSVANNDKDKSYSSMHKRKKSIQNHLAKQEVKLKNSENFKTYEIASVDAFQESQIPFTKEKSFAYTSLTPASSNIRYREGFNVKQFLNTAKPMVSYSDLN